MGTLGKCRTIHPKVRPQRPDPAEDMPLALDDEDVQQVPWQSYELWTPL